jgi:hypothetical protein
MYHHVKKLMFTVLCKRDWLQQESFQRASSGPAEAGGAVVREVSPVMIGGLGMPRSQSKIGIMFPFVSGVSMCHREGPRLRWLRGSRRTCPGKAMRSTRRQATLSPYGLRPRRP